MPVFKAYDFVLENKKHDLLRAIQDTQRGLVTSTDQRSSIEEALVWFPSKFPACKFYTQH
jgi:hypothetical protein